MKKIIKLSLLVVVLLSACSKEKKLERSFYTKDGEWNIAMLSVDSYKNGTIDDITFSYDAGKFIFEKDGTGTCVIKLSSSSPEEYSAITWTTLNVTINADLYSVKSINKNRMSIETSSFYSVGLDNYRDDIVMTLDKVK